MIYFKFDFKKKKDRWLFVLFVGAICAFFGLAISGTLKVSTYNYFCVVCHEMNPEYQTWKVSSHSSLNCSVCHQDSGIKNLWNYEKILVKRIEKHFTGKFTPPIAMASPIPQKRCLNCHTTHRKTTPRGDIIIPHERHEAKNITCTECHSGVAHGNISDRGLTEDKAYLAWTPAMARNEMGARNTGISMQECMECHQSLEVKTTCEDCHGVIKKPTTHFAEDFLKTHGKSARKDLEKCDACHSYSSSFVTIEAVDSIAQYARENNFCADCHIKRPIGHSVDWRNSHGKTIGKMDNRDGCLVCHDDNRQTKAFRSTESSCNSCHGNKHTDYWRYNHEGRSSKMEFSQECLRCHPAQICGKCHYTSL